MRNATHRRSVAVAVVLVTLAALGDARVASAQGTQGEQPPPPRPMLRQPNADPNDWEAYFDQGVKLFREAPAEAGAAFYWASRLEPSRAEPLFARWANFMFRASNDDVYGYLRRDQKLRERADIVAVEELHWRALMRNPFVHRGLEILVYDRLPGKFNEDRDTRAWIAYTAGNFPQAVSLFGRGVERGGESGLWRRYDRSLALVANGEMAAALADLRALVDALRARDEKEMVVAYASKHHLLYMIAMIQNQMGNRVAAREAFGEALVEDAAFAYGYAGLAAMSRVARQHATSAQEWGQAIELEPNDGFLHYQLALTLFDLQRYQGAADALDKAIALEPYYAAPRFLYGRVRERQGREVDAYPHYERFVALASAKDPQARSMKLRLELRAKMPARADSTR